MNAVKNRIAIVSASPYLPRALSSSDFWKSLVNHDGLVTALMTKQWPFSELQHNESLKSLKEFFMKSGMNPDNIDVPETVFPVAAAKNVLRLLMAKQAIDTCTAFSAEKVKADKIKVLFAENDVIPLLPDIQTLFTAHHHCQALSMPGAVDSYRWLKLAIEELTSGNTELIIAVEPESTCSISSFFRPEGDSIVIKEGACAVGLRPLDAALRADEIVLAVVSIDDNGSIAVENPFGKSSEPAKIDPEAHLDALAAFSRFSKDRLVIDPDGRCLNLPFNNTDEAEKVGSASARLDWKKFRTRLTGESIERRFLHDLLGALAGTFISRISLESPVEFMKVARRPVIYVANHQIGLESPLFMTIAHAATGLPVQAVAKPDHIDAWLSFLMEFAQDSLEPPNPFSLLYFDRNNPQGLIDELKQNEVTSSLLVHVDGTRSRAADVPAAKISSIFIDLAVNKGIPLVPVRFVGGLPSEPVEKPLDFPYKNGKQDYLIGAPISADQLAALPYGQRPKMVLEKINSLGPKPGEDLPLAPDKEFVARTAFFKDSFKLPTIQAMLFAILQGIDDPCEETAWLIKAVQSGKLSESAAAPDFPPVLRKFLGHMKTKFQS